MMLNDFGLQGSKNILGDCLVTMILIFELQLHTQSEADV